jgi:hypothetical protein
MKLLTEQVEDFEILAESTKEGKKNYYIRGIFMQAESKNQNGRLYPKHVMESGVNKYIEDYVSKNRGVGTLDHENTPQISSDRISHLVTELKMEGNDVYGKAKILETNCGKQLIAMIDGGVNFGVSSRALGSLKEENGTKIVQPDFTLAAIDAVLNPSCRAAFVEGLLEEAEWVMINGEWIQKHLEHSQKLIKTASSREIESVALKIFENYISTL